MGDPAATTKTKEVYTWGSYSQSCDLHVTMQDREVDAAIQALQNKVQGVKGSLSSFVGKMEHELLTWCVCVFVCVCVCGESPSRKGRVFWTVFQRQLVTSRLYSNNSLQRKLRPFPTVSSFHSRCPRNETQS